MDKKRKRKGERPDGRIQVTYQDGIREDGKPKRISFYGKTRKEAIAKRDEYIRSKEKPKSNYSGTMLFDDWIAEYAKQYDVKTLLKNGRVHVLQRHFEGRKVSDIKEIDCNQFIRTLEGKSSATIIGYRNLLNDVFAKAVKNGLIDDNPAEDLIKPKGVNGSHRALEKWEIDAILNVCTDMPMSLAARLMLLTGMRKAEAVALDWKNVDMENDTISICAIMSVKTGKEELVDGSKTPAGVRVVPICKRLHEILNETPPELRFGAVCRNQSGRAFTMRGFPNVWANYLKRLSAFIDRDVSIRTHDLRHTHATWLYESGMDVKSAAYLLGHANINMTMQIYVHLTRERQAQSVAVLTRYIDNMLGD